MLLFVYGTLLRGEVNHGALRSARFLSEARTEPRFELVDLGAYPGLVRGGSRSVAGELYEVGRALLVELDAFEGHPDLFRRARVLLEGRARAHAYLFPRERAAGVPRIESGSYRHAPRARTTTE
jgi:gamma-glutamylaminecyclotransferase